jgi:hypothetical protein
VSFSIHTTVFPPLYENDRRDEDGIEGETEDAVEDEDEGEVEDVDEGEVEDVDEGEDEDTEVDVGSSTDTLYVERNGGEFSVRLAGRLAPPGATVTRSVVFPIGN